MKNKNNIKKHRRRTVRTFVAVLSLLALTFNIIPLPDLGFISEKLSTIKFVHAGEDIIPNPTIDTVAELVWYSKAYQEYPQNHQFDNITLAFSGDVSVEFTDFVSIGTSSHPFGGTITISSISTHQMNLNCAFFDYVYDYVEIYTASNKVLEIATAENHTNAIFANHIIHDFTSGVTYHESGSRGGTNQNMPSDYEEMWEEEPIELIEDSEEEYSEEIIEEDSEEENSEVSSDEINSEDESEEKSETENDDNPEVQPEEQNSEITSEENAEDNSGEESVQPENESSENQEFEDEAGEEAVYYVSSNKSGKNTLREPENNNYDGLIYGENQDDSEQTDANEDAEEASEVVDEQTSELIENTSEEVSSEQEVSSEEVASEQEELDSEEETSEIIEDFSEEKTSEAEEDSEKNSQLPKDAGDEDGLNRDSTITPRPSDVYYSHLTIKVVTFDGAANDHGSLIGTMHKGSKVYVTLINESSGDYKSSANTGLICGTVGDKDVENGEAELIVEGISGSAVSNVSASGTNHSAGGFVGELTYKSKLTLSSTPNAISNIVGSITSEDYCAGGIVGCNDRAVFDAGSYNATINNTIRGNSAAGGIFGYYCPQKTDESVSTTSVDLEIDLDSIAYQIGSGTEVADRCKVISANGSAGGLFGTLKNQGGIITITGTETVYAQGTGTNFGGLIGKYDSTSVEDSLLIEGESNAAAKMLKVNASRSGNIGNYGGLIGLVDVTHPAFVSVRFTSVSATGAGNGCFGGAVARADCAYLYVNTFSLSATDITGGGVIGHTENGVVHLAGALNLSGKTVNGTSSNYGQIVGYRDDTFVFADSSWDLTRRQNLSVDDIGSWGEVVRFKSTGFVISDVLNDYYDPSAVSPKHYVTLKAAPIDEGDGMISIGSKAEYAKAALNMQLNTGTSGSVLVFEDEEDSCYSELKAKDVEMTDDIDLSHTGMTGLTRDNKIDSWTSGIGPEYAGKEFNGGGNKLTLAIGESYEGTDSTSSSTDATGKGKIYRHRFNGVFGEIQNSAFNVHDVELTGKVFTYALESPFYVGTIAGNAKYSIIAQNVTVNTATSIIYGVGEGESQLYVGGLVGNISDPGSTRIGSASYTAGVTNCTFGADISSGRALSSNVYVGGVAGFVGNGGTVTVNNIKITNAVSNDSQKEAQKMGGLFGVIEDGTNTLNLNGVELNNLTIKGKMNASGSMGGLLGYSWSGVTATFDNIKVVNCVINNNSGSNGGNTAGLVYSGSGKWMFKKVEIGDTVNEEEIPGIAFTGNRVNSFGMLVNKAGDGSKAMYMVLPQGNTYIIKKVTNSGMISSDTIYDELAAYSKMGDNDIEANGNSVISLNTKSTTKYGTKTDSRVNMDTASNSCNTYQNQVTLSGFNTYNPNTRYYYNLDTETVSSLNVSNIIKILFVYSVKQYAHQSIKTYFNDKNFNGDFSKISNLKDTTSIDMKGYSYYPFDVTESITGLKGIITLYNQNIENRESDTIGDNYARTTLKDTTNNTITQHYLMHAGLFRNVSDGITVSGKLTLRGTFPVVDNYCGTLVCGTVGGELGNEAKIEIDSSSGSILLDGVKIYNKNTTYSPLLINNISEYAEINISNVSATGNKYSPGDTIATSLIGTAGSETARSLTIKFSDIKLDGRTGDNEDESDLTSVYNTSRSLFIKATLLDSLSFASGTGSSGIYNYTYDDDWGGASRNVTYGYEISDDNSKNKGKEYYYYRGFGESSKFTNPVVDSATASRTSVYPFTEFLPYVYVSGSMITNTSTQHQLDVNHAAATFDGCGTYNHPYTIAYDEESEQSALDGGLQTIANIISKTNIPQDFRIKLPDDISTPSRWCNGKNSCKEYVFDGEDTFEYESDSSYNKDIDDVIKYLAGAYYSIETDIELEDGYQGLGNSSSSDGIFHGVIVSDGKTITNWSDQPLIYASNGSVIKNLRIEAKNNIELTGGDSDTFNSNAGCGAYGTVIGRVFGGDNIIDKVEVDVTECEITSKTEVTPVGAYIGVIVDGGVFFRNMDKVAVGDKTGFSGDDYSESSKQYLYCNPLIGRVIYGFAVNETSAYAPYENGTRVFGNSTDGFGNGESVSGAKVSLHNGNKNYSITDINSKDTNKLSVNSSNEITIPNSQAFFIMSLIVNSGIGTDGSPDRGYYGSNHITRHADYSYVGTDIPITETTTEDYKDYAKTLQDTSTKPYLIEKYTTGDAIKKLGTDTFKITVSNDIILPDGYKGIGNIFDSSSSLMMSLSEFDSGNKTISQNTTFFGYTNNSSGSTKDNYLPYANGVVHGLGLFNYINSNSGTFKNCILTGNVVARQYHDGKVLNYTQSDDYTGLTTGMLIGTLNMDNNATITDVYLQNTYSESTRDAGGMIGYLCNTGKKLTVTNSAENTNRNSEKIYVNAGTSAGGIFARQGDAAANHSKGVGDIDINLNNHFFNYSSIVSRYNGSTAKDKWNADWTLGVGGLIGVIRANDASGTNNNISISNIKIGSSNETKTRLVACKYKQSGQTEYTYGCIYSGGLVGIANRAPIEATNCEMYNVSVESRLYSGGVLGWGGTKSDITLNHFTIEDRHGAKIYSSGTDGNAGCVVGFCKTGNDTQSMGSLKLFNSTIKGYDIEAAYAGGVLGDWTASKAFSIINSEVYDCDIKYITAGGGIAGKLQKSLDGYNVRMNGITLSKKGSTKKQGYIVGQKESAATIKMVGFHRIGTISEEKLIGSASDNKMSSLYGSGGYVVFADYMGSSATTDKNTTKSDINFGNVPFVAGFESTPFITVNPANTIDANIGLFTGDGVSVSARNSILTDTSAKKYQVANIAYFKTNGDCISSFSAELGDVITDKAYDFPMIIVNDTNSADTVINNYLGMLTNTTLDFSNNVSNKTYDGTVNGDDKIGVVSIRKCSYANGKFTISNSKDACLTIDSSTNTFVIRKDGTGQEQYDTANSSGQFTLIDVAFKAPSETGKAAYHLYVPVYVKKLLEYSFDISSVSGTSYERSVYESDYGNTLLENLGTPITMEFKYTYFRTAAEWASEGSDYHYDKKLKFSSTAENFASDTTMVLVDANNNGKAYYLDTLSDGFDTTTGVLDLSKFKDSAGNSFVPLNFNALTATNSEGFKTETYYLSIFTNKTNKIYHYAVTPGALEKTGKPTRRVDCHCEKDPGDAHYVSDIILGDFFDNSVTVSTPAEDTVDMTTKDRINVGISATVNVKNTAQSVIGSYLKNPKVTMYHSLLLSLEKYNSSSVKTGQEIAYLNQAIINSHTIAATGGTPDDITTAANTDNTAFVEFPTGMNIKNYITDSKVATISADVTLIYTDSVRCAAEFPYRDTSVGAEDQSGAVVVGYSSISSNSANAAYSVVSAFGRDIRSRRYYSASESEATLSYNASYEVKPSEDKYTIDNQLGINGHEMAPQELAEMHSIGIYDTSKLSKIEGMKYILCELELYERDTTNPEAYNANALNMGNYITRWKVCGNSGDIVIAKREIGTKYYYILDITKVEIDAEKVYRIPIDFWVVNGSDLETSNQQYCNYKLKLTTTLLKDFDASEGLQPENIETKSSATDYVIYTNSNIYTDRIR